MKEHVDNVMRAAHQLPVVFSCAVLLLLPTIINQAPFVYFDSAGYLSQAGTAVQMVLDRLGLAPAGGAEAVSSGVASADANMTADDVNYAGRSIYYSFFAWAGAATLGAGSIVVLQSSVLAWLLVATMRMALPNAAPMLFATATMALAGGLALLTSAGLFTSLIMPDVWAGIMILALALLVSGTAEIGRLGRGTLTVVIMLAALFHSSHLALLAAMVGLLVLAMLHPRLRAILTPRVVVLPTLALVIALSGHFAFSFATSAVTGQSAITRPFVTAHLVDMGPGTRFIEETCPESGFAVCAFADRLATDWIGFLFSDDPQTGVFALASPAVQRALSQEQARFALAVFAAEPLATTGGLIRDGVAQLWHLSVDDVPLSSRNEAFIESNFTQGQVATIKRSTIWDRPWVAPALTTLIQASTALAAMGLLIFALTGRLPRQTPLTTLLLVCLVGFTLNALICGILASPYGRFQARVSWILPLLFVLTVVTVRFPAFAALKRSCS